MPDKSIIADGMSAVSHEPADNYDPRGHLDPAGFERHVRFPAYPFPADLARFIEHFWSIRWEGIAGMYHSEEVMHRPYVDRFVA